MDHPPLSVALLWLVRLVLGDSLLALRIVPALLHATIVVLTAVLARRLGGGGSAQLLAALATAIGPVYLALTSFYSMNAIDLGGTMEELEPICETTERAAVFSAPYVMPYEDQLPIHVCRGLRVPLAELWPVAKHFD